MRAEQNRFRASTGWERALPGDLATQARLVLVFGARELIGDSNLTAEIERAYPSALAVGCSTAGEIAGLEVTDDSMTLAAVAFDDTEIRGATLPLASAADSYEVGTKLGGALRRGDLSHVLVLSEGLHVNGSALASGINAPLAPGIHVTGGLAGDGERFEKTLILAEGTATPDRATAVGLYGSSIRTGFGSLGGWDPFGPERLITGSEGNVLHELDGRSALEIYRRFLGPYEKDLPASALLFPLAVRRPESGPPVVRTVLAIDDEEQTMTFAGDMPQGSYARFMKANFDRLLDGAKRAALNSYQVLGSMTPELALLISCVGRKMVLKQRTEEEVEAVSRVLGDGPLLTGFYSYGEISPCTPSSDSRLHNQTMTITAFAEVLAR